MRSCKGAPDAAHVAMAAVERIGRDALSDMRSVLGVLRHSGELALLTPQPGVGQLYSLVEATRTSGRQVDLMVERRTRTAARACRARPRPHARGSTGRRVRRCAHLAAVQRRRRGAGNHRRGHDRSIAVADAGDARERAAICSGAIESDLHAVGRRLVVTLPPALKEVFA